MFSFFFSPILLLSLFYSDFLSVSLSSQIFKYILFYFDTKVVKYQSTKVIKNFVITPKMFLTLSWSKTYVIIYKILLMKTL